MQGWEHPIDPKTGKPNRYCLVSPCGKYTICKIGGADGFRYELWVGKEQVSIGHTSAEAAMADLPRITSTRAAIGRASAKAT